MNITAAMMTSLRTRQAVQRDTREVSIKNSPTGQQMITKPYPKDCEPRSELAGGSGRQCGPRVRSFSIRGGGLLVTRPQPQGQRPSQVSSPDPSRASQLQLTTNQLELIEVYEQNAFGCVGLMRVDGLKDGVVLLQRLRQLRS